MTGDLESSLRQLLKNVMREVAANLMEEWKASARHPVQQAKPDDDGFLLTPRETAKRLAISERHLFHLTHSGQLPCVRVGKCVRYNVETIQQWVREAESADSPPIKSSVSRPASGPKQRSQSKSQIASRNSTREKATLPEQEALKEHKPLPDCELEVVHDEERRNPFDVLLNELGLSRCNLPQVTNGYLMRIAKVDIVMIHRWLYRNQPLPEVALNRLKEHFRRMLKEP